MSLLLGFHGMKGFRKLPHGLESLRRSHVIHSEELGLSIARNLPENEHIGV